MSELHNLKTAEVKPSFDLKEYFNKIGFAGAYEPTLSTLKSLHLLHPLAIPFENLDALINQDVKLELGHLNNKLIACKRGGWCFEQNLFFAEILKAIGFKVKGLAARVRWNIPENIPTARGHMLLLVEVGTEKYIADVGFGILTLTAPLLLKEDVEHPTTHETFRLKSIREELELQVKMNEGWRPVYRFSLQEQLLPDYEVTNWYLCHSPESHFLKSLIVTRPFEEGRYILHDKTFKIYNKEGKAETRSIDSIEGLAKVLEDVFEISVDEEMYEKLREKMF